MERVGAFIVASRSHLLRSFSRSARLKVFGAVFFIFAPTIAMTVEVRGDPLSLVFLFLLSGLIGACWAGAFLLDMRLLFVAIAGQALTVLGFTGLLPSWAWPVPVAFDGMGLAGVLCIALSYTLAMWYVNDEGVRSIRQQTELRLAQRLHESMVPAIERTWGGYLIRAESRAASEMGGDLVDVTSSVDGCMFALVDVSGHGVRAGVVMASIKAGFRLVAASASSPSEVASRLNALLCDLLEPGMFATGVIGVLDESGVRIVGCGHPPVGLIVDGVLEWIEGESLPLGVVPEAPFEDRVVPMSVGGALLLYTDGLTEAGIERGEALGLEGLKAMASGRTPSSLLDAVDGYAPRTDDRTVMLIDRRS